MRRICLAGRTSATEVRDDGVSVTGESHVRMGHGNGDAWRAQGRTVGTSIAVADGVGSAPLSRRGADAAVAAATSVADRWLQRDLSVEAVPEAVTIEWLKQLQQGRLEDFATTVLLGAVRDDGTVLLAWRGDGLIRAQLGDAAWGSSQEDHDWGSTPAMRASTTDPRWQLATVRGFQPDDGLLLATDGISEDVDYPAIPALLAMVGTAVEREGAASVARRLKADLEHWQTPERRDDRTMAALLGVAG
jgi:serine/threonine protein phosphatase PrpC